MMTARDQIAAVVPGGVPDITTRARLCGELFELTQEMPEVDVDEMRETVFRGMRAIFADGLMLDENREMPLVDRWIEFFRRQMELSENLSDGERRNEGVGTPEFYSGALEGLQLLRKDLIGKPLDGPRVA